jgi:hypothetical protein
VNGKTRKLSKKSPPEASVCDSNESAFETQKKLVEALKTQWKLMWSERFDDKVVAEGVSANDYDILQVERGLIIHATREFKALNFKDIVHQRIIENPERYLQPDVRVGGWNKFIKTEIAASRSQHYKKNASLISERSPSKQASQQPKKGGRGWLHTT